MTTTRIRQEIPGEFAGQRLDQALATLLPDYTRSQLQQWIEGGHVRLEGELPRKKDKLKGGETVEIDVPPPRELENRPQPIPLDILHEDSQLIVIAKPAGLIVHPGAGNPEGTLLNALLHHAPALAKLARAGIVHRLDKDTSGLLVVAKTERALRSLQAQIQSRRARRDYLALVHGRVAHAEGKVDAPIGRDPRHRIRMAIVVSGRRAVTHYRVAERFADATLLEVRLDTGRTHQIRVHLASLGHPVAGDRTYGRRPNPWGLRRQALHACRLSIAHPVTGAEMVFTAPLPSDMEVALQMLRAGRHA
jgi:23S rRNA pseudouridine1911/1915/1917 synthase